MTRERIEFGGLLPKRQHCDLVVPDGVAVVARVLGQNDGPLSARSSAVTQWQQQTEKNDWQDTTRSRPYLELNNIIAVTEHNRGCTLHVSNRPVAARCDISYLRHLYQDGGEWHVLRKTTCEVTWPREPLHVCAGARGNMQRGPRGEHKTGGRNDATEATWQHWHHAIPQVHPGSPCRCPPGPGTRPAA
jgi:hypothetical protein